MGSSFTHTHVRSASVGDVVAALRELAVSRGLVTAEAAGPCDHDVVVVHDPMSPLWTSIYRRFDDTCAELSLALETHVLEVTIFDSDVLEARLYNDGAAIDVFCSDRGEAFGRSARSVAGQPRRWDSACTEGRSWRDVRRVFGRAREDPEGALVELGGLVGLHERSLYPDHVDPAGPSVHRLRFRNAPEPRRRVLEGGPAVRAPNSAMGSIAFEHGQSLSLRIGVAHACTAEVVSVGGMSGGIEIAVGGEAVEEGIVELEPVLRFRGGFASARECKEPDGRWLVAEFDGLPAASGLVSENPGEMLVADSFPRVQLDFTLRPLRAGEGEMRIRWMPLEPRGAVFVQRVAVRVE
jgi:hypothetical protein